MKTLENKVNLNSKMKCLECGKVDTTRQFKIMGVLVYGVGQNACPNCSSPKIVTKK